MSDNNDNQPNQEVWDKERCKLEYFNQHLPSLRNIAKKSGFSISTIRNWSVAGDWVAGRSAYRKRIEAEVEKNSVEKLSQEKAKALETQIEVCDQSLSSLKTATEMTSQLIQQHVKSKPSFKETLAFLGRIANILASLAASLERTIRMQRLTLKMDEPSIPDAIKLIEANGYQIADVDAQAMVQSLQAKGYTVIEPEELAEAA